jgi:hypothetical protein
MDGQGRGLSFRPVWTCGGTRWRRSWAAVTSVAYKLSRSPGSARGAKELPLSSARDFIRGKTIRGSLDQVQIVSNRRGWVAATRYQHQWRGKPGRALEAAIHHAVDLHPLERGRDDRNPETHCDEIECRREARGLLANLRIEARRVAGGNRVGVQAQPLPSALNNECFASEPLRPLVRSSKGHTEAMLLAHSFSN